MSQAETAAWMGYRSADEMNAEHDQLHADVCAWLALPSLSLKAARGEPLSEHERVLAECEENAVLHLQRFRQMSRS